MNRFILDDDPYFIAMYLCDQHIVKMPLEEAQMLSTAVHLHHPKYAKRYSLYKPTHRHHPCTVWAAETDSNYMWAYNLYRNMLNEYLSRFGKHHKSGDLRAALLDAAYYGLIPKGPLTPFPQCMPDQYRGPDTVEAYRRFYIHEKMGFARYNNGRTIPEWAEASDEYA